MSVCHNGLFSKARYSDTQKKMSERNERAYRRTSQRKKEQRKRYHSRPNYRSRVINILNNQVSHINRRIIEFGAESNVIKFK
jgi:predicted nucleotidyltransferase